jgi:hypothetical protein
LNPKFFRFYELDAFFPEDWKLEVAIYDKGTFVDNLIGQTTIDLENRLYSNLLFLDREAVRLEQDTLKERETKANKEKDFQKKS